MATVFDVLARFRADTTDYTRNVHQAANATNQFNVTTQNAGRGMSGMFGMVAGRVGMLGTAIVGLTQTAGMMGIRTAQANEQAAIGFKVMLGSAAKAKEFMDDLIEFSAKTPFELPQLRSAASALLSTGVEAKRIIPIMTVLGDATSAKGYGADAIQRAVYALQQMSTAGRATGQDMMQLTQAGIPVWEALAASMGKSIPEIKKLGEQGKISAEDVMKAIETGAGAGLQKVKGMMDEQSKTLTGLISTFKDTLGQSLGKMMEPAVASIKEALPGITSMMDAFLQSVAPTINSVVGTTLSSLVGLLPALQPLVLGFGQLFTGAMQAIAPFLPMIVSAMTNLTPIFESLGLLMDEVATTVTPLVSAIFPAFNAVLGTLAGIVGGLTTFIVENKDAIIVMGGAYLAFKGTMMAIAAYGKIIAFFKMLTSAEKMATIQTWLFNSALYANPIGVLVAAIVGLIAAVVLMYNKFEWFRNGIKTIWNAIVDVVQFAIDLILGYWEWWINKAIDGINLLIKAWNKLPFKKDIETLDHVNLKLDITGAKLDKAAKNAYKLGDALLVAKAAAEGTYESSATRMNELTQLKRTLNLKAGGGGAGAGTTPNPNPTPTGGEGGAVKNPLQGLIDSIKNLTSDKVNKANSLLDGLKQRADSFRDSIKDAIMAVYSFQTAFAKSRQSVVDYDNALKAVQDAETKVNQALANRDFSGYQQAVKDYTDASAQLKTASEGKKTFLEALKAQYDQAKDFGVIINRLRAAGLNEAGISQIVQAGAETGMAIGNELLNGGSAAIGDANKWYTELVAAANTEADAAKNQFYAQGLSQGEALVKGITDAAKKLNLKLESKGLSKAQLEKLRKDFSVSVGFSMTALETIATPMAKGGIVRATSGGTLALIGEAGRDEAVIPLPSNGMLGGNTTYHIEVNVGVGDKHEIGREIVNALQAYEKRSGRLPIRTM
jgi:tape measure domain-containing protein